MRGNQKLIETLNALLADELAAINQYIVCGNVRGLGLQVNYMRALRDDQ